MRLVKFLAHAGVASRRAAEQVIADGRVTIAGEVVLDPARDVAEDCRDVAVDGRNLAPAGAAETVVYMLNKPAGVVSTAADPQGRRTVVSLINTPLRVYPVGRLDADTTGLILLTNDGELAHRLTHPSFEVAKTYRAKVAKPPVSERALRELRAGVLLEDGMTAPARAARLAADTIELTIHEGRKRQVKRMCEEVGHPVLELCRTRLGPLRLGELKVGQSRLLGEQEVSLLRHAGRG